MIVDRYNGAGPAPGDSGRLYKFIAMKRTPQV